jgi:hypothetical protein
MLPPDARFKTIAGLDCAAFEAAVVELLHLFELSDVQRIAGLDDGFAI